MKRSMLFLMCFGLTCLAASAWAADVTLKAEDGFGVSSFNSAANWNNGLAPSAGNNYFTGQYRLRTPANGNSYTFAGDSLTINVSASPDPLLKGLSYKGSGSTGSLTINNLILNGGVIVALNGSGDVCNLYGNINVVADSYIHTAQGPINVYSAIHGSYKITNPGSGNTSCVLTFHSSANTFTGSLVNNGRFTLADNAVLNFVIGANGVSNSVSGTGAQNAFNGDFNFDLTGAGNAPADRWAIVTAANKSYGETFNVVGFTDEGNGIWSTFANGVTYEFDEATGYLSVFTQELNETPLDGFVGDMTDRIVNRSFELPGTGDIKTNWDAIPGWTSSKNPPQDSGVIGGNTGANGTVYHGFIGDIDEAAYQITDVNMVADTQYTLEAQMRSSYSSEKGKIALFYMANPADPNTQTILSETEQTGLGGSWVTVTTSFVTPSAGPEIGKPLRIMLDCTDGDGFSFTAFDEIRLYEYRVRGVVDHTPTGSAVEPADPLVLSWTPTNDPNYNGVADDQILYYYIANGNGTNPDYASYVNVGGVPVGYGAVSHAIAGGIAADQYCMWRVDTVIDGVTFYGKTVVFSTRTADEVPVLTPGDNWLTWRDQAVTVSATVNDSGEGDVADADNVWSLVNPTPWSAAMQMFSRAGNGNLSSLITAGYDAALFEDWIGTDARNELAVLEPMTLTLSGVPAGVYTWTSYHHDVVDQTGPFDVTVIDASGSATTTGIDVTNGAATPVCTFSTTITSDGVNDIQLVFENTGTENNTSMFVMNGFVLSDGVNPDLAIDFGRPSTAVAAGCQAYAAEHEVESTFSAQSFSALGTTVTVSPSWNASSYYAVLTDASSDPLAPAATLVTNYAATYTVQLDSTDRGGSMGDQAAAPVTLTVRVVADACAAATAAGTAYNMHDADQDCDVDMADFAAFAAQWLSDISLTGPVVE